MYAFLFDSFLQDRKFAHEVSQIEQRLAALGLQGRSEKMTILKNLQETARSMIKRGATTLVLVGNDETVTKILPQVVDEDITIGLIPVGPHQAIAQVLGIPNGTAACDTISRRVIRQIDLGKANEAYFLFSLTAPSNVHVDCGPYTITSLDEQGTLTITNFPLAGSLSRPDDGQLELVVQPSSSSRQWGPFRSGPSASVFAISKAKLSCPGNAGTVMLDGQVILKTPVTITVPAKKLEIIVGKQRNF